MTSQRTSRSSRAIWALSVAIFAFGFFTTNFGSAKWIALTLGLFSIPLLAQFVSSALARVYALWLGMFLVLQSTLSPWILSKDLVTLPPNLDMEITLAPGELPGIVGTHRLTTDEQGFRVTKPINYATKSDDTYRVVAIGGSTTEQILLDDRQTWTHLLQEHLEAQWPSVNVEVINTGVSGLRAEQHIATLAHIIPFEPDLVVFLIGINDWNLHIRDTLGHTRNYLYPFRFENTMLGQFALTVYKAQRGSGSESPKPRGTTSEFYTGRMGSLDRSEVKEFTPDVPSKSYQRDLSMIADLCNEHRIDCMLLSQPTAYEAGAPEEITKRFWMTPPAEEYTLDLKSLAHIGFVYNEFLPEFARENELLFCDLDKPFRPSLELFYDDCHFTLLGAGLAATTIANCIGGQLLEYAAANGGSLL